MDGVWMVYGWRMDGVCAPQALGPSGAPSFLARWRVCGRPTVQGPAGIGSVGDVVGEGSHTHAHTGAGGVLEAARASARIRARVLFFAR